MSEKLDKYREKRDFEKTSEPQGRADKREGNLRFVVQHHLARRDHYDFRLEWEGTLLSWAVPKGPSYNPKDKRLAVRVEDHPIEYKDFEGTIPKGEYGGGTVMLWDEGVWEPVADINKGLEEGSLKFTLFGSRLKGGWALARLKNKEDDDKENWLLIKEKDDFALSDAGIEEYTTSVRTGRTMEEIEEGKEAGGAKNPFEQTGVQLAKLVAKAPESGDWVYELKYDGYRILAYIERGAVRLMTRNHLDYTGRFLPVAEALRGWAKGRAAVLDGEMVVADESGKTDFQALQQYIRSPKGKNLTYIVFDLLALDGQDLRALPLTERKKKLIEFLEGAPDHLRYSRHIEGKGKDCFAAACRMGMEGIVGKKASSGYLGARNGDWIKIKCDNRQEFVVGGYTLSEKAVREVSALLLGVYDKDKLVYAGRAGSGLTERGAAELIKDFDKLTVSASPFEKSPRPRTGEKVVWLRPERVAEVRYAERTSDGLLRQARFKGLRTDKNPRDVVAEQAEQEPDKEERIGGNMKEEGAIVGGIRISNPDKVMFEEGGVTKADVARYYEQIAARMLPYVQGRVLSIVRCPKGVNEACFFKKHPDNGGKGIVPVEVPDGEGGGGTYFYIEGKEGLIAEAQMGTLEFHTWGSRADRLETPDIMVFDLDPDEGMDIAKVRQGVKDLKEILEGLNLKSYLKTSGGKGYHVVVPVKKEMSWEAFHDFARGVAQVMENKWPDRYTSNARKEKRKGRIFIDWMRNGRGATSVAPYSLRARKGAKVSMPVSWAELEKIAPDGIDMKEALRRAKLPDPWKDFFH